MNNRAIKSRHVLLIVLLLSMPVWQVAAFGESGAAPGAETADFAKKRISTLHRSAESFRELAGQPIPSTLSDSERKNAERHAKWLNDCRRRLDELANRWQLSLDQAEKSRVVSKKQIQEMNQSFNLQYLGLQQQMQDESRRFTLVSNIMKTKHDTARNSINNLR
jgi:hypothetical protein